MIGFTMEFIRFQINIQIYEVGIGMKPFQQIAKSYNNKN